MELEQKLAPHFFARILGIKFLHFYFVFNCRYFLFALKRLFPRDFCVFFKAGRRDEVEKLKKHTTVTQQPGLR